MKTLKIPDKRNKLNVLRLQAANPNLSTCKKCGLPWNCCKHKSVQTSSHKGTFATCDVCWDNSTINELKGYYTNTYKMQERSASEAGYNMEHTLEHLLNCVEKEFNPKASK